MSEHVAICLIPNCGRRAPPDEAFCSHHRDQSRAELRSRLADDVSAFIAAIAEGVTNAEATAAIMDRVDAYAAEVSKGKGRA